MVYCIHNSQLTTAEKEVQQIKFISSPWVFQLEHRISSNSSVNQQTRGIAVSPNGNTCLVNVEHTPGAKPEDTTPVFNRHGHYQFSLDIKKGIDIWNVVVNADGIYYVTVPRYVKIYDSLGVYRSKWVAVSPDKIPSNKGHSNLGGLTIDSKDHILVGNVSDDPLYISKHRQDGPHIASFKVDIKPYYLAATSHDTVVIGNAWEGTVQIVDSTGHLLHQINATSTKTPFWNPHGLCCYNDIILVCNSDKEDKHELSCFSVSAEYMGSIPVMQRPLCAAVSDGNGLVKLHVACHNPGEEAKVYHMERF